MKLKKEKKKKNILFINEFEKTKKLKRRRYKCRRWRGNWNEENKKEEENSEEIKDEVDEEKIKKGRENEVNQKDNIIY